MSKITPNEYPDAIFWPGDPHITSAADRTIAREDILAAIERHYDGDWGDVSFEDKETNVEAAKIGGHLFSVYHDRYGVKFWIITDCDRSITTVLLPDDY